MSACLEHLRSIFLKEIGIPDLTIKVPGRANIIGEHIGYCGGTVLPFSISQSMYFIAKKRPDQLIKVKAIDLKEDLLYRIGDN